jgi:hypothetical protein
MSTAHRLDRPLRRFRRAGATLTPRLAELLGAAPQPLEGQEAFV